MFFALSFTLSAQSLQLKDGRILFEMTGSADSLSSTQINERALNWIGSNFKSAEAVITSQTPSRIVGTFIMGHHNGMAVTDFTHTLTIDIKDGRFRFTIDASGLSGWVAKNKNTEWRTHYTAMKGRVESDFNALYESFVKEITNNSNDW